METQIQIDNWTASKVKFCSFDMSGVWAMDYFLEVVINCSKSLHQIYKLSSHRFCSPANGSLVPNIQVLLSILHGWISFLSSQQ